MGYPGSSVFDNDDSYPKALTTMWKQGISCRDIAERLGMGRSTIWYHAAKLGLKRRDPRIKWPAERRARLRELWMAGQTVGQIASMLGCTNNAVTGTINRMGLTNRFDMPIMRERARQRRAINDMIRRNGYTKPSTGYFMPGIGAIKPDGITDTSPHSFDPPPTQRVALADLESHHCRFPFGEGLDTTYCGRDREHGHSYCRDHHLVSLAV